jgi:hypothetical protein
MARNADGRTPALEQPTNRNDVMKIWKKLQNPFALVGQGFVLGGVLFFATHVDSISASPAPTAAVTAQR